MGTNWHLGEGREEAAAVHGSQEASAGSRYTALSSVPAGLEEGSCRGERGERWAELGSKSSEPFFLLLVNGAG